MTPSSLMNSNGRFFLDRLDVALGRVVADQPFDLLVHLDALKDADAALEAGAIARLAADRFVDMRFGGDSCGVYFFHTLQHLVDRRFSLALERAPLCGTRCRVCAPSAARGRP